MINVGLTGGMGSGKSTVAKVFKLLNIPVLDADFETKRMMETDAELKEQIIQLFGAEAYKENSLNRKYIASIVFKDKQKLTALNTLTHPKIISYSKQWAKQQQSTYCIKEAALLFESGANKGLGYVIGVYAPKPLRIKRIMQRGGITEDEIIRRMDAQMDEEKKMSLCDFVIKNDETALLLPQILKLHLQFSQTK